MPSETSVRRRARRLGYCVIKSRQRKPNIANHGYYRLIDANNNWVVLGERFDARLEDIDEFLNQKSDVLVVVHTRKLLASHLTRRDDFPALVPPFIGDHFHHFGALTALGVTRRRLVFREAAR